MNLIAEFPDGTRLVQGCADQDQVCVAILSLGPFVPSRATWWVEPDDEAG